MRPRPAHLAALCLCLAASSDAAGTPPAPAARAFPAAAQAPAPGTEGPEARGPLVVAAAGDVQLSRRVAAVVRAKGWAAPFRRAAELVASADVAFCNLECPASYLGSPFPGKEDTGVLFRADPGALLGLKAAGFDVASLANNHAMDWLAPALEETLAALDVLEIERCGAGRNAEEARRPAFLEAAGRRLAFLAYVEPMWSAVPAGEGAGVALIDAEPVLREVRAAAAAADLVFVSLHWGEEHRGVPREEDRAFARSVVDAGAAAVIGHHPHVLQGAEFHKGAPILYSLGNFVFDMVSERTYDSAVAYLEFDGADQATLRFRPVLIDRADYAPAPAAGADFDRIAASVVERCAALGAPARVEGDYVVVGAVEEPVSLRAKSSMPYGLEMIPSKP